MVRFNKKTKRFIRAQAAHYRNFYSQPCPEADAVVSELREAVRCAPKDTTKEEEIKYILEQADRACEQDEEIKRIFDFYE